jgi:hypothetical protein
MLVDFGIAKEYVPGQSTLSGALALTPGFAPLEQYATRGQTDARTDLYSLGGTLYYLLTGVTPLESLNRGAGAPLPGLREVNPRARVPAPVEAVVLKAMALQKQDRWQSAAEMRQALAQAARHPAEKGAAALPPTKLVERTATTSQPKVEGQDRRGLVWILGGVAAALLLLLALLGLVALVRGIDGAVRTGQVRPTEVVEVALNLARETATMSATSTPLATAPTATLRAAANPTSPATPAPSATSTDVSLTATPTQPAATMPPAGTVTQRVADTATLPPAPTQTATAIPTRTLVPTRTPRPTVPRAATATRTATVQPVAATARPTSTAQPPAPSLISPADTTALQGIVNFVWSHPRALSSEEAFQVLIWRPGEVQHNGAAMAVTETQQTIDLDAVPQVVVGGAGDYHWTVVLVNKERPEERLSPEARWWTFTYTGPRGGRGGDDGGKPTLAPP